MDNIPSIIIYYQMLNRKLGILQRINSRINDKYEFLNGCQYLRYGY